MEKEDYQNREELRRAVEEEGAAINAGTEARWEQVHVSFGLAAFDAENDKTVEDVVRRADKRMYENKRRRKMAGRTNPPVEPAESSDA